MATTERPLRRDAQHNRELILQAARELFAERGLAVTMDDVAERAKLGVGTVYRRFPSRDELIDALFEARMVEIVGLADEALAAEDPWEGLTWFLERVVALQACDRGLKEVVLGSTQGRERVAAIREQMRPRALELVRRAQAAGQLRADFDASDLPLVQLMLGTVAEVAAPERPELWRRYLSLLLGAMAADSRGAPLDEPPLGFGALDQVMCRWRPGRRPPA